MLVSVTERTRENRQSARLWGPKRRDILWQFPDRGHDPEPPSAGCWGIVIGAGVAMLINAFSPFPAVGAGSPGL